MQSPVTEAQYIEVLKKALKPLSEAEREEILRDQAEHFAAGRAKGRGEPEIIQALGPAEKLAREYLAGHLIEQAAQPQSTLSRWHKLLSAVASLAILAPLNFLVLTGPVSTTIFLLIAGWVIAGGLGAASFFAFGAVFAKGITFGNLAPSTLTLSLASAALLSLAALGALLMGKITQLCGQVTLSYLRWNLKFIQERQ